jgi:hypothetical protein
MKKIKNVCLPAAGGIVIIKTVLMGVAIESFPKNVIKLKFSSLLNTIHRRSFRGKTVVLKMNS